MDVAYRLSGINFVWDRRKAGLNLRKHGISFESTCEIFFDPFIRFIGKDFICGEMREIVIGMTVNWRLLRVVYTFDPKVIRLISARAVTIQERKKYEEQ
jgi:uncharacterized protein